MKQVIIRTFQESLEVVDPLQVVGLVGGLEPDKSALDIVGLRTEAEARVGADYGAFKLPLGYTRV